MTVTGGSPCKWWVFGLEVSQAVGILAQWPGRRGVHVSFLEMLRPTFGGSGLSPKTFAAFPALRRRCDDHLEQALRLVMPLPRGLASTAASPVIEDIALRPATAVWIALVVVLLPFMAGCRIRVGNPVTSVEPPPTTNLPAQSQSAAGVLVTQLANVWLLSADRPDLPCELALLPRADGRSTWPLGALMGTSAVVIDRGQLGLFAASDCR